MSINNQHKPGYKHTPLGWIPEEWHFVNFGDLADKKIKWSITGGPFGSNLKAQDYTNKGVRIIQLQNIGDGVFLDEYKIYTSSQKADELLSCNIYPGEIIISKMGDPVARACFIPNHDSRFVMASDGIRLVIDNERFDKYYAYSYINSIYFRKRAIAASTGSTRQRIGLDDLKKLPILSPSLPEQRKIAAIFSTWDEAITKTQQFIAQLQQRNKGLMQQLLTGKTRLKGFKGEWKKLHATDIFKSVSVKNNGTERLLSATQDRGIIPRDMLEARVTMPTGETGSFKLVEIGDFVISLRSFQGGIEYSEYRGLVSPAYTVLKPTKPINTSFFKHYFKSYDFIGHLAVAVIGIRDGKQVSYEDFSILKLSYPDVAEQEAIASVLNAACDEVKLYEQKLAALQQQKKELMQKLLTGEVRVKIDNNQN